MLRHEFFLNVVLNKVHGSRLAPSYSMPEEPQKTLYRCRSPAIISYRYPTYRFQGPLLLHPFLLAVMKMNSSCCSLHSIFAKTAEGLLPSCFCDRCCCCILRRLDLMTFLWIGCSSAFVIITRLVCQFSGCAASWLLNMTKTKALGVVAATYPGFGNTPIKRIMPN